MSLAHPRTALIFIAAGLFACQPLGSDSTTGSSVIELPEIDETVRVISVTDGDSFRSTGVDGNLEVRLLGINAPESDECYGPEAAEWLEEAIGDREVGLALAGIDQFGRALATVVVGSEIVNLAAVSSGSALVLSRADDRDLLLAAEAEARRTGVGLWGDAICGAQGPRASLSITGIDYDPPGPDQTETVVIENTGSTEIDLAGFVLRDESSVHRFTFPSRLVPPAGMVSVASGQGDTPSATFVWSIGEAVWNNSGDTAFLLDRHGRIVSTYRY
ncbi:MAG: lamin tail domain-containing protein [Actinomycetota bacterium]